jgi:hypothetical protein
MPAKEYVSLRKRTPVYVIANNTFFYRVEAGDRY